MSFAENLKQLIINTGKGKSTNLYLHLRNVKLQ